MSWLDLVLLTVWIVFIAVGARLGSLWIGSCVMGGFLGAFLADYYALSLSSFMGGFSGSEWLAGILLFLVGIFAVLIPGTLLSRMSSALFLGVIDSAMGLATGALAGLVAVALGLLLIVPLAPQVEKTKAWRNSLIINVFSKALEGVFHAPEFRMESWQKELKSKTIKKISPAATKAINSIKDSAEEFVDDLKK